MPVWIVFTFFSETVVRIIQLKIIINVFRYSCKVPVVIFRF